MHPLISAIADLFVHKGDLSAFGVYCAGMFSVGLFLIAIGAGAA